MRGEYVLTQADLLPRPVAQYDAVEMGSYHVDVRVAWALASCPDIGPKLLGVTRRHTGSS
jgi:hypothetical protein